MWRAISTISLVDMDVGSFSSYIYQPTPWAKHTKTIVRGAPSLGNPSCSKLYFFALSLAVAVAVAIAARQERLMENHSTVSRLRTLLVAIV